ncbi:MAG: hypothetical protein H6565_06640 [Lewinellaceae bacterium]|nr:hypothetical protein [Lewinellaceae bacterium]
MPANHHDQAVFRLGTAVYAALAALAAVFYLERMAMLDMSFQTFHILRTGSLQIQSERFGAACTQVFPWLAQAAGLPLKGVLIAYSLGHVLYYFVIFTLIVRVMGQWKWGLVLLLLSTMMTTHTFYWLSEMPQGLAFLVLVMAWLHLKGNLAAICWWEYPFLAFAIVTAFYFHPMVLYAAMFCCLFFGLEKSHVCGRRALYALILGLFLLTAFVKYKVLKLDWYDAMSLERAGAFSEQWPHWFDIQSNRDFLRWCLRDYYLIPLAVLLNTGFYLRRRIWWKALLVFLTPAAYVLLVNVPFYHGDNQFYLENLYLPLAIFSAVPLVFDVLPVLFPARFLTIIAILLAIRIAHIFLAHQSWTERLHWEQSFLTETARAHDRKLILSEQQVPMDKLIFSWGTSTEFLILSSLDGPDGARCILVDEYPARFDSLRSRRELFLGEFRNYPFDEIPRRYFNLRDTSAYVNYRE